MEIKIAKPMRTRVNKKMPMILLRFLGICMLCSLQVPMFAQESKRQIDHPLEDSVMTGRASINGYPFAFYTPETKFAAGAGGIFIFYTAKDTIILPSKIGFAGWYSTNKQYKISINPVLYFFKNKLFLETPTSFGHFEDKQKY